MDIGVHIAVSGAIANERILEQVTHNLANAPTPGFKRSVMHLEAVPFSLPRNDWAGSDSLAFVQARPPVITQDQGVVEETGRPLDLAIEGKGRFQVSTPQGVQSVRKGDFLLNPDGTIVTREGHAVLNDQGKSLQVDRREKTEVSEDGEIRAGERKIGRLMVVDEDGRQVPQEQYRVAQGHLERSNVNPLEEMVTMMEQLRNHGSYMKLIRDFDELEGKTIQELGRV
jgi:flagellar basal-body rod protein FlgF